MAKIIGNTTATPNPKPDWNQTDETKANYIKNKPFGAEAIETPVGELYADSGKLIADGQMYQYNHSLGIIAGETYMATAYVGETMYGQLPLTALDNSSLGSELPEGVIALCIMESDGSVDTLVGFDNCIVDDGNPIYSNSHCLIGNMDDTITKIVIEGLEGTYERVVYHKLPNEYVDVAVDKTFNPQSLNAQSGAAVEQAIDDVTNKFPRNVITQLSTLTTLGDQHIKVSYAGGNSSTHPTSSFYNVYTEGIGLNSDLNTTKKDTIVNAINENVDNIEQVSTELSELEDSMINTVASNINGDGIFVNYDITTENIDMTTVTSYPLPASQPPTKFFHTWLPDSTAGKVVVTGTPFGFMWFDCNTYQLHEIKNGVHSILYDYSHHQYKSVIDNFIKTYPYLYLHVQMKGTKYTTGNQMYIVGMNYGEKKVLKFWNMTNGMVQLLDFNSTSLGDFVNLKSFDSLGYRMPLGSAYNHKAGCWHSQPAKCIVDNENKPGIIAFMPYSSSAGGTISFGQADWSNAQSVWNNSTTYSTNRTLMRALDVDGVEQLKITNSYGENTYIGIDNNEHSAYYVLNEDVCICLSSSRELLYRSFVDGSVIQRIAIDTTTDLFTSNLQFCSLCIYGNTLYAFNRGYLYAIDYLNEHPLAIKTRFGDCNLSDQFTGMNIVNDCLAVFDLHRGTTNNYLSTALVRQTIDEAIKQPDWNQNDSEQMDYIQNRPFYSEEVPTEYITLPYSNVDADLGVGAYGKTLELALGSTYTVDLVTESGTTTLNLVAMELSDASTGISGAIGLTDDDGFVLYDGMVVDADGNFVAGEGVLYEMSDTTVKVLIHGFDGVETVHHKIPTEYVEQGDWAENDQESSAYIKNRTHYKEEVEVDYLILPYAEPIPGLGLAPYGRKIGLELNTSYNIEVEVDGQIVTLPATTSEMPKDFFGVVIPGVVYLYQRDLNLHMLDGIEGDFATGTITGTDNCYYNFVDVLTKIKIHGVKGVDTKYHKLPKEYYDISEVDQVFNPESKNAQSGIAVQEAIDNYNNSLIITTEKLVDKSVTTEKLVDKSVDFTKLADNSVGTSQLMNKSVTSNKLQPGIPYGILAAGQKIQTQGTTGEIAYMMFSVEPSWEELFIMGRIKPSFSGEQYFCIDHSSIPGSNHLVQLPIDTTNIEEFAVGCLIRKMSSNNTLGTLDIHLYKSGSKFYAPETYAEKTIPFCKIPTSGNAICLYLKDGDTESFLGETSIEIYIEKQERYS